MTERSDDRDYRRRGSFGCINAAIALILILAALGGGFWYLGDSIRSRFTSPDPVTIATSSLRGLREQNRLSTFSGSYVAVVTSKQTTMGLTAQKTMIMPGTVRYEVDLSKMKDSDLSWDATTRTLTVTLPQIEVIGPEIDIDSIKEYSSGGIVMTLTNAEGRLDAANRKAGQEELLRQASSPVHMRMARAATKRAVENSFLLPLRAVGVQANVNVVFLDETGKPTEQWDVSADPRDVIRNKQ